MQYSIFDGLYMDMSSAEVYRLIRQAGFDGVLLWWGDKYGNHRHHENPELARKEGLFVENIHVPFDTSNDLWADSLAGLEQEDMLKRCIDDCATFQIPTMVMHVTTGDVYFPEKETGLARMERIVDHAEHRGVNIAVENLRENDCLKAVFDRIPSPMLGFCFDSGHQNFRNRDIDLLSLYGHRLIAMHLHDNDTTADQHLLPYEGNIDWETTIKRIKKTGYTGPFALEVKPWLNDASIPIEEYLKKAYASVVKLSGLGE